MSQLLESREDHKHGQQKAQQYEKRQWELLKSNFLTFVLHHGFQKHIFFSFPNQETNISFKL